MKKAKKELDDLSYGEKIALTGLAEFFVLAILKAAIGFSTGMIVLVADALASCSDMLTIFASYLGLRISKKSATKQFGYGYYKVETFAALIVSLAIFYLGFVIFFESLGRFQAPEASQNQFLGVIMVIISASLSIQMTGMFSKAAKKINSLSLMNGSKDTKIDIFVQIAVLLGIGASTFHIPYVEGVIGMGISFMTLKVGFDSAKQALFYLLDYFDDRELMLKVEKTLMEKSTIVDKVHGIKMRRAGTFIFGEAILEMSPYVDAQDIRMELRNLKEDVSRVNPYLKNFSLLVHIPHLRDVTVAVPVKEEKGLQSELADTIGETRAYMFVTIRHDKIAKYYSKPFHFEEKDCTAIADFLLKEKAEIVVNNYMSSLLYYHLHHLKKMLVYPNFDNLNDVESTIKLLLIDM